MVISSTGHYLNNRVGGYERRLFFHIFLAGLLTELILKTRPNIFSFFFLLFSFEDELIGIDYRLDIRCVSSINFNAD